MLRNTQTGPLCPLKKCTTSRIAWKLERILGKYRHFNDGKRWRGSTGIHFWKKNKKTSPFSFSQLHPAYLLQLLLSHSSALTPQLLLLREDVLPPSPFFTIASLNRKCTFLLKGTNKILLYRCSSVISKSTTEIHWKRKIKNLDQFFLLKIIVWCW